MLTRREAAIITAYTGITLGDYFAFSDYAEEKLGTPPGSAEMSSKHWWDRLHEASKADFLALEVEPRRERPPFPGNK